MITVKEINGRAELLGFIKFPWFVYRNDPYWVPPLISERLDFFDPKKNPYYDHSEVKLLMAYRDGSPRFGEAGQPVGRLSVHENKPHVRHRREQIGFFGFFECIDDFGVAKALFDYGLGWLKSKGYHAVRGPANFSINGEYSLLVDGFDSPPMILMTYNPAYYVTLIERYGFTKSQDMYAYCQKFREGLPERVIKRADEVERNNPNFRVRKMDLRQFDREVKIVQRIYADAWDDNWGAVPFYEAEIMALGKELKLIIDPGLAFVAEFHGQPIGFSLSVPDFNQALKRANGRLFPLGLVKLLLAKRRISRMRVLAMGVLKEYRHLGFDTVFYRKTLQAGARKGYDLAEMSLINESNIPMNRVLQRLGARIYKTYRMYDRSL